jgi:outer membrane protein assembly factor BamB
MQGQTVHSRLLAVSVLVTALIPAPASPQAGPPPWPSFRGPDASGVAADGRPPVSWSLASRREGDRHVVWRTAVPGLGPSSPIVWGDRVYLTTAVAPGAAARSLRTGDVDAAGIDAAADLAAHQWQLLALDRATGKVLWTRTAHQGVPRVKRHVKGSHASATPATNGSVIVALLGSEGLFAFDMQGTLLWRQDLGVLDVGLRDDPAYQWGPASSPVIAGDRVIVQNDRQQDSFLAAFELQTGAPAWRSARDELPSWSTPIVHRSGPRTTVVTNSPRFIRGHDAATGRELWRVEDPEGEVKVSTPTLAGDLVIVTGGYPPAGRPIYAIRVADGSIAWRHERGSPYTSTPIVVDGLLYVVTDNGILSVYRADSGERLYQQRLPAAGGSYSASPVSAGGRVYFTSEDGSVFVVRAGRTYALLASNEMDALCFATPAISGDLLLVRTATDLFALAER